jgi:formylmethanofuran dehydrogenase subunit E
MTSMHRVTGTHLARARRLQLAALVTTLGVSCAPRPQAPTVAAPSEGSVDGRLARVAEIHGGAGPWAVAGFRMGEAALKILDLPRGSFDLEVVHFTPPEVQYSCEADGAAAATGASVGKRNLRLAEATAEQTHTMYRKKSTGQAIGLRTTAAFAARYRDLPRERLGAAGREVMQLPDADIFETVK